MNELNMGSAVSHGHSSQRGSHSSSAKPSSAALPPNKAETVPSGKELPSSASLTAVNSRDRSVGAAISEQHKADAKQTAKQTAKVVDDLNKVAVSLQRDLNFKVDEDTGKSIITVTDSLTQKVIRQIPSEEIVELAKNLQSMMQSVEIPAGNTQMDSSGGSLLSITV